MKTLAIIPARGGSKRIPRKNIREFNGKPIISHVIKTALDSELFDEVMVSTNDNEIMGISKTAGAAIPFLRSEKNSDDFSTTNDVLIEVLEKYSEAGKDFDLACCIYPTAALITKKRLIEAKNLMMEGKFDAVFPVLRYRHPIQRALEADDSLIKYAFPGNENTRTQDLKPTYFDSGQFYWFDVHKFNENKRMFSVNTSFIELSEMEGQDIDNQEDWELAELKFNILNSRNS